MYVCMYVHTYVHIICIFAGFIIHAGIMCFFGFWLFHLGHLLFSLACPFKAKKFIDEYHRITHIVEVIIAMSLGLLPGAVIIGTSKYQISSFPPDLCVPGNSSVFFYTYSLTVSIGSTIGLGMLFTAFSVLRRVSDSITLNEKNQVIIHVCILTMYVVNLHISTIPIILLHQQANTFT